MDHQGALSSGRDHWVRVAVQVAVSAAAVGFQVALVKPARESEKPESEP
jgi:hypothetical protein